MKDLQGREYAKLRRLHPGDKVKVDGGFEHTECLLKEGTVLVVHKDTGPPRYAGDTQLYISCAAGRHFLDGQLDDDDNSLIGIYPA